MKNIKPRIVLSKCINYEACRYNGLMMNSAVIERMKDFVEFITVCPEVEIGLPIPRESIRLMKQKDEIRLVKSMSGEDFTDKMVSFSKDFVNKLENIDGFILKSRSPSCGFKDVKLYSGIGKIPAISTKSVGLFAQEVLNNFSHLAIEDEGRLTNLQLREHFLTKIYTSAEFRHLPHTMKALVDFHASNKYLFMAYNQAKLKNLGKVVANHEKLPVEEVFAKYQANLYQIFQKGANISTNINVLMHIFGYFSKDLNNDEKAHFLEQLDLFRQKKIPLIVVTTILNSWIMRFKQPYLSLQRYFNPFPKELMSISDSGK
jgi:uncharacterized protein YbgA (DUF1722 family)/uncharacterized protein YbbK (DUF523 family)